MQKLNVFLKGLLAGISICIGSVAYLSVDNKIIGSLFFSVGLFMILTFEFNLFTGKVCYVFENDSSYALDLIFIWTGNLVGSFLSGELMHLTRISGAITEKAAGIAAVKLDDNLLSLFILAIMCNILIYIAVDGFKKNPHELGKYLGVFVCVPVFIICGFEHCVANMVYFTIAKAWSAKTFLYILVASLGNAAGGVIIPLARKLWQREAVAVAAKR